MGEDSEKHGAIPEVAADVMARRLVRAAGKAALATIDRQSGGPYASLVTVGSDAAGAPTILISKLAQHTQNLLADPRASILFETDGAFDPLTQPRVTVMGEAQRVDDAEVKRRFLARHPEAAGYAAFADFGFWRLTPARGHYVGGFGRIHPLKAEALLLPAGRHDALAVAEAEIVEHMNTDHADAVALYATRLLGAPAGDWRMTGIDGEGLDLMGSTGRLRLPFSTPVHDPAGARAELVRLAAAARARG
jgi:heme iron utilization protein